MKPFTKSELTGVLIIFLVLIAVSAPNFVLSLRRARDQVRRDDLGALVHALDEYLSDFEAFPPASPDGRVVDCTAPGSSVTVDDMGRLVTDLRPCEWGEDPFVSLVPSSNKTYMRVLPRDPQFEKGLTYLYLTDGNRYQIYSYMEGGKDEADYDPRIVARNLMCGNKICNVGRSYNVPIDISIEEYNRQLLMQK